MTQVTVRRTYVQLLSRDQLKRGGSAQTGAVVVEHSPCPVSLARELYTSVGEAFHWTDRLSWSDERFATYLGQGCVRVFELLTDGQRAGYFELLRDEEGGVEIAYFGLLAHAFGRGLGRWLLERAVDEAFALEATRVWLHTCTLDAPSALPNYLARGFVPYATEEYTVDLPAASSA